MQTFVVVSKTEKVVAGGDCSWLVLVVVSKRETVVAGGDCSWLAP